MQGWKRGIDRNQIDRERIATTGRVPNDDGVEVASKKKSIMAATAQNHMEPLHDDGKKREEYEYEDERT